VAYATVDSNNAVLDKITIVTDWGIGPGMSNTQKVPSVISYSPRSAAREQQFGFSLSPKAVSMLNTKLELDVQDSKADELDLILQALEGMDNLNFDHVKASNGYPEYTWKAPEDIVTDFLTNVFPYVNKLVDSGSVLRAKMPVDIVVTVPVVCE
jgi:hypothetical protein